MSMHFSSMGRFLIFMAERLFFGITDASLHNIYYQTNFVARVLALSGSFYVL
jgi:hypothetical protein